MPIMRFNTAIPAVNQGALLVGIRSLGGAAATAAVNFDGVQALGPWVDRGEHRYAPRTRPPAVHS